MSLPATSEATSDTPLSMVDSSHQAGALVLENLQSTDQGLSGEEAARRLAAVGPNALRTHKASPWSVLVRQLRSPILILLIVTAGLSLFLGDATNSIVIGVIFGGERRFGVQQ